MVPPVWGWYVPNSNYSSSWTLKMELLVVGRTIFAVQSLLYDQSVCSRRGSISFTPAQPVRRQSARIVAPLGLARVPNATEAPDTS